MEKRYDITAVGECLIDVIVKADEEKGGLVMEGNPGGAPLNALAASVKLGLSAAFIGKLSTDAFGRFLHKTVKDCGVSDEGIVFTDKQLTTLAVVTLDNKGDRSFSFYRNETSDVMLESGEVDVGLIAASRVLHFGSVSMTCEPSRGATLAAAGYAKENGITVSYDPNLRERLWKDLDEARDIILKGMGFADIVKVSEEELVFLTGLEDIKAGAEKLLADFDIKILAVTLGAKGAAVFSRSGYAIKPTYDKVKTIDTTGAGDSFWGAFLYCVIGSKKELSELSIQELEGFLDFANAAGSLSTTKKGAIPSLPTEKEIRELMAAGK
ncbi:MAG: carbohydrate kinase [Oscillospiraceae bacterium]